MLGKKHVTGTYAFSSDFGGPGTLRRVFFLVVANAHLLDLAGPLQIITTLKELGIARVPVECVGPRTTLRTFQKVMLSDIGALPPRLADGDVLFVIGSKLDETLMQSAPWAEAVAWLRSVRTSGSPALQLCGVCTGTFLLAQAGLLSGRVCTTHHRFVRKLRHWCPDAHVVDNRVLVRDRDVWTSAGVASGVDLALHVVAHAYGDDAAVQVARENVVHFRRFGSDPELNVPFRYRSHGNQLVHSVQDAIGKGLASNDGCEILAQRFGLSVRHLSRLFSAETGISIKRYQIEMRMELARRLLLDSGLTLENVVERCGFSSVQAFRANWNKREKLSPSRLRQEPDSHLLR
ncbi:Carnitine catabolism transcriptional activator [Variovorax sp. SRS16]|nr:Carnitine catabolism transcriptional activator [Variovorax sp. SRS16]